MSLCDVHDCLNEATHSVSVGFEPASGLPGVTFGACYGCACIFAARQSATGFESEATESYDIRCLIDWAVDAAGDLVMVGDGAEESSDATS